MDNPGDYYKRKEQEADEAQAALTYHQLEECKGISSLCKTCKELERRLELARYVGD